MPSKLGEFKQLDVRSQWPKEGTDFTPWLAQEDNLAKLGEALGGLELELDTIEASVGPYHADILAKTIDGFVIIENQLGKIDHDHLGKALTYASFLDAKIIVWIATQFTEEHQRAIEWLNDKASSISFYAVVVELWKIDESNPAVKFNVISKPANVRTGAASSQEELTPTKEIQFAFWSKLRDALLSKNILPSTQTPRAQQTFDVSIGRSDIFISNILNTWQGIISIRIYIRKNIASQALPQLMQHKEAIEQVIGEPLVWDARPDAQDKLISLSRNIKISDRSSWDADIDWLAHKIRDYIKAFKDRIKKLDLKSNPPEEIDENNDENCA